MLVRIKATISALTKRIKNSPFIKSVLTLSAGVVVAQFITLAKTPVISRIYDPVAMGDFSVISSNASILDAVVVLGLLSAIMLPREDDEAKAICRTLLSAMLVLTAVITVALIALSGVWRMFSVELDYNVACLLLGCNVIAQSLSALCYAYVNRQKMYRTLFWNPLVGSSINAVVSIALGLLRCGAEGLIIAGILTQLGEAVYLLCHANPFARPDAQAQTPARILKKYRRFPLFQMPADLVSSISCQLPVQLIGKFFGSAILGSYSMCMNIFALPARFLATPVNRVYYKEAADRYGRGESIGELSYKVLATNVRIAAIPIAILIIFGEPLFAFLLGEKWRQAGMFASILGMYQLVQFCSSCIANGLVIINRQRLNLVWSAVSIVINLFSLAFGTFCLKSIEGTLILFSLTNLLFYIVTNGVFLHYTGVRTRRYLSFVALYIVLPTVAAILMRTALIALGVL